VAKNLVRTVTLAASDLTMFRAVYKKRFPDGPPMDKDSSLIRFMAVRGCQAFKAELATLPRLENPDDPDGHEPKGRKNAR